MAGLAAGLFRVRAAERLAVSFDGDNLRVAAPQLHFLTGKSLSRLKDAAVVVYLSQLTIFRDNGTTVFRRTPERLAVSYDLWEEKFRVTLGIGRRSISGLSASEAEAWCLDNLAISTLGLPVDRPFWLRFELRTADPKEFSTVVGEPGISISGLIEIFSRKPGAGEPQWMLDAGPLRLVDLPRIPGRGKRNG